VTQRGTNGQTVFYRVADRKTYLDLLRANLDGCNMRILAFCLMSKPCALDNRARYGRFAGQAFQASPRPLHAISERQYRDRKEYVLYGQGSVAQRNRARQQADKRNLPVRVLALSTLTFLVPGLI
jgi:hypothetical protein